MTTTTSFLTYTGKTIELLAKQFYDCLVINCKLFTFTPVTIVRGGDVK